MLIENDLMGRNISQSISGIGINVNQEVFHSTAPNPVSLRQITGKQYDIFEILKNIMLRIQSGYELLRNGDTEPIAHRYEKALFRKIYFVDCPRPVCGAGGGVLCIGIKMLMESSLRELFA